MSTASVRIALLGTLDTKGPELDFLAMCVRSRGAHPLMIDTTPALWVASPQESRAALMEAAGDLIADELTRRYAAGEVDGMIVVAGASGAALATASIQRLPLGVPKVLVSPVAAGETALYVGTSDLILVAPVVDFVGRSAYADEALDRAAAITVALSSEQHAYPRAKANHIGVTAFGVTSPLVQRLGDAVNEDGDQMAVFSANGVGGRSFERFLAEGRVYGAFDITTSELADELFGGVLSAGPTRLTTAARCHVPQVVLPGAIDFINFREEGTVPPPLRGRPRVAHTPCVTLVRTSPEENAMLAKTVAERIRPGMATTAVVVPTGGFSLLSELGGPFWDPQADAAFIDTLLDELSGDDIRTVDAPINSDQVCRSVLEASRTWRKGVGKQWGD